ncbi:MAG: hypothetical protein JWR15_775 [Prosthecobacter sp.]|nr:hypothetical protein [Prosthecobacter sp.]
MKLASNFLTFAVIAFTFWQARALGTAWFHSPHDHQSWAAFACWVLTPLLARAAKAGGDIHWLAASLGMSIAGTIADLSELHACAFATALAACTRAGWERLWWFAGFVSWTSALGWLINGCSSTQTIFIRLMIAMIASCPWFLGKRVAARAL